MECENLVELKKPKLKSEFFLYGLKESTSVTYENGLRKFLKEEKLTIEDMKTKSVEEIENLAKEFILSNVGVLAPKYLNVVYSSIKTYLHMINRIRSRKAFLEIKFDKSSPLIDSMSAAALESKDMKQIFALANGKEKIDLGLYGLCALRPRLIPQIRVKDIHHQFRVIDANTGRITIKKPALIMIPNIITDASGQPIRGKDGKVKRVGGNKANIVFPCFIPSVLAEIIELYLNQSLPVTLETKLSPSNSHNDISYIVNKYFDKIGYKGRTYDMRNFGSVCLRRLSIECNDKDLEEFLMGHKPKIGTGLYTLRGAAQSSEKVAEWETEYTKSVDRWINENVFGHASAEQLNQGKAIRDFSTALGLNQEQINGIFKLLEEGKMSLDQYKDRMRTFIDKTYNDKLLGMVNEAVSRAIPRAIENLSKNNGQNGA